MYKSFIIWLLLLIPSIIVETLGWIFNPIVALFTTKEFRKDRIKRAPWNNKVFTIERGYLIKPLRWFQTHDNAVDEWWYGNFNAKSFFKFLREAAQKDYDSSWFIRYLCRVMWMYRNNVYGFLYHIFGRPLETRVRYKEYGVEDSGKLWWLYQEYPSSFQFEAQIPWFNSKKYTSINIGWKPHKGFEKVLYANRFINLKTYE